MSSTQYLNNGGGGGIRTRGAREGSLGIKTREFHLISTAPTGKGPGIGLQIARAHAGASINDLTDDQRIDTLCGNAAFSGQPVTVQTSTTGH